MSASVYLYRPQENLLVGRLLRIPGGDQSLFVLDETYRSMSNAERPLLSFSFLGADGLPKQQTRITNTKIHPWFANLLPEGHLRQYVADQHGFHQKRDFPLIVALGGDLPGGVIVEPNDADWNSGDSNHGDAAASANEADLLKFSLAGVQLKFSAVRAAKGGLTIPARGRGGSWIVKLPSEVYEAVPENEYDMMRVARKAGFDVPETDLVEMRHIDGLPKGIRRERRAFVIRRFDRTAEGGRVHMEDFAQIFGLYPAEKYSKISYGNIARVIHTGVGEDGLREFVSRLVFNAAIGNGDMHAKNWSLIYRNGKSPEMAPPYDFLSTLTYVQHQENMGLSMAGTKRFEDFSLSLLQRFSEKTGLPSGLVMASAKEAAERTWEAWTDLRGELASPGGIAQAVDRHMRSVPIMQEVLGSRISMLSIPAEDAQP
jgi:serine/threonine-protein kinase HipA